MIAKKIQLVNDEIYHVVLRGVGDSLVFKDINDYYRGIFSVYEFNNFNAVSVRDRRSQRKKEKLILATQAPRGLTSGSLGRSGGSLGSSGNSSISDEDKRDKMVEILAFCFMPNHIHLLVRQLKDNGISRFMQKLGGYAVYFNKKYNRKGHLFNKFKSIHIETNDQLKNVFVYIHANPISLIEPGFKEKGIKNPGKVKKFLENYKWSSYQDYIGIKNFPSVTKRDFLLKIMGGETGCKNAVEDWIKYKKEIKDLGDIILE